MAKNLKNFRRDLNRVKISTLYSGPAKAAEKVVTELQEAGPSWTGLYSNSWQIEIEGQKSTGTRREGNPQPVKAPKLSWCVYDWWSRIFSNEGSKRIICHL